MRSISLFILKKLRIFLGAIQFLPYAKDIGGFLGLKTRMNMQNFLQCDGKQFKTDRGDVCTLSLINDSNGEFTVLATDEDGDEFKPHMNANLENSILRFYGTEVFATFAIDLNNQNAKST